MIKERIRRWLGLTDLENLILLANKDQRNQLLALDKSFRSMEAQCRPLTLALGRMIAQKDKYFAMDEMDPQRKAESDALGEQVIKKLKNEDAARRHTAPFRE